MDCTSSMSSWIKKAKETLNKIIDQIIEECKEEGNLKVRVCFVGYRDIKDGERFTIKPFTDDVNAIKTFIANTGASGGADEPEDLQGGLKLALLQDWTEEASKRVFIISDAPCHGREYHNCRDDYPNGSPDGLKLEDLMKEFCKKDIEFQFIKLNNNCDIMIEIMKKSHQEIEVTDMTGVKSQPSYSGGLYHEELAEELLDMEECSDRFAYFADHRDDDELMDELNDLECEDLGAEMCAAPMDIGIMKAA